MSATTRIVSALVLAGPLAGCGTDFAPASYLDGLRVLAIEAEPLEVGPQEPLELVPVTYLPEGLALADQDWTFCPFSLGPELGYACAAEECVRTLAPEADGSLLSQPLELAAECLERFADRPPPAGLPAELPGRLEMTYRYRVRADDGQERLAAMRINVFPSGVPEPRNRQPVIAEVAIAGRPVSAGQQLEPVAPGERLEVRVQVDPQSLDTYLDESGRQMLEEPIVSFFATAGRFDHDREAGSDVLGIWKAESLEPDQLRAEIYLVVRDLRGGQLAAGPFSVPIGR